MNRKPILSICVPTFNRLRYLRDLLPALVSIRDPRIEIVVSNNASTDGTTDRLNFTAANNLRVYHNVKNIGGERNFMRCVELADGAYVWVLGDDELVNATGILRMVDALEEHKPAYIILRDNVREIHAADRKFDNYAECLKDQVSYTVDFPLRHTLISANVFRKDVFNAQVAADKVWTNYSLMFGIMDGVRAGGSVLVMSGVFSTRKVRAQFDKWPFALCCKQAIYLRYIAKTFNFPALNKIAFRLFCNLPIEMASVAMHTVMPKRFGRT